MSIRTDVLLNIRLPVLPLPVGGLDVWKVPLPNVEVAQLLTAFGHCLSQEEHRRLQSRRLPKGQMQFVFTRVVLRHLLSSYHPELTPAQWQILKSESGRPHLSESQTPLCFNLTHTGDCLMFAFSQYAAPGIDVELLSRVADFDAVAKRFFSLREYRYLSLLPQEEQAEFFYRLWTLKEAAVKASGLGLARGLHRFQFMFAGGQSLSHQIDNAAPGLASDEFVFWSTCFQEQAVAVALMSRDDKKLPVIKPVSRLFVWPAEVTDFDASWLKSQSRNSSTNFEP